ncbi:MAG: hypothetical protein DMG89_02535 [Acidobacteria bacterium]|nr:MAG: hypothetical protein DMG89_02535 [Acidobacteriota bacterium]
MVASIRTWFSATVLFVLVCDSFSQIANASTPAEAVVEILTATKPDLVEKHLPEAVLSALRTLSTQDRMACERNLLIRNTLGLSGAELRVPEDGHALVVLDSKDSGDNLELQLRREIMGGREAVLELTIGSAGRADRCLIVWMSFEDGEWRIAELQWMMFERRLRVGPELVEQFRGADLKITESAAITTLNAVRSALISYQSEFPEVGLPDDLSALGPPDISDVDPEVAEQDSSHAWLLDKATAANVFEKDGYMFRYQEQSATSYTITARPLNYDGKARSFFIDESGEVHATGENREATLADDPVDPGDATYVSPESSFTNSVIVR